MKDSGVEVVTMMEQGTAPATWIPYGGVHVGLAWNLVLIILI
jgi:hypothetical protein